MRRIIHNILFLIILPLKFISCSSGYKKIDGKWNYVSYDEGNWADKYCLNVDHQSFKTLDDKRYGKDYSKVFFEGKIIENAESKSFRLLGNDYSADDSYVFLKNYALIDADPKSFKQLKHLYSRDKLRVYCGTIPMKVQDIEHFRVTKSDNSFGMQPSEIFIKNNPDYSYIDTANYKFVIYAFGEAETPKEKFKGIKKLYLPTSSEQ
jgi:hypothetical protein